ncbi:hypothetical protein ACWC9U_35085 [Streptomyces sp. 900116325]
MRAIMRSLTRQGDVDAGVWVTVCLPTEAAGEIDGALAEALAPFYLDTDDNSVDCGMRAPGFAGSKW